MAYIISSLSHITYSFTVHGPDVFVHRLLLREKIAGAKFVRTISLFNKAFLCGLYPGRTEGKVVVVRTGVNPDVYAKAASSRRRAARANCGSSPWPRSRRAAASRFSSTPARGWCSGPDIECRIVGDGPLRNATETVDRAAWHSPTGAPLGTLPQHEVAQLMGEADVFVLPSVIAVRRADGRHPGLADGSDGRRQVR